MKNIRVDPDKLNLAADETNIVSTAMCSLGKFIQRCADDAPSYDGQFGPFVNGLGIAALVEAVKTSDRILDHSSFLIKRALLFLNADLDSASGLKPVGVHSPEYQEYLKKLGLFQIFPPVHLLMLIKLGMLKFPTFSLPVWLIDLFRPDRHEPSPYIVVEEEPPSVFGPMLFPINEEPVSVFGELINNNTFPPWLNYYKFPYGRFGTYTDGRTHPGLDLRPEPYDPGKIYPIHPIAPGKVVLVKDDLDKEGNLVGWGHYIIIRHETSDPNNPVYSLYAHLNSKPNLGVGDDVGLSSSIGDMGQSGGANGVTHLHLEVYRGQNGQVLYSGLTGISPTDSNYSAVMETINNYFYNPEQVFNGEVDIGLTTL